MDGLSRGSAGNRWQFSCESLGLYDQPPFSDTADIAYNLPLEPNLSVTDQAETAVVDGHF